MTTFTSYDDIHKEVNQVRRLSYLSAREEYTVTILRKDTEQSSLFFLNLALYSQDHNTPYEGGSVAELSGRRTWNPTTRV